MRSRIGTAGATTELNAVLAGDRSLRLAPMKNLRLRAGSEGAAIQRNAIDAATGDGDCIGGLRGKRAKPQIAARGRRVRQIGKV